MPTNRQLRRSRGCRTGGWRRGRCVAPPARRALPDPDRRPCPSSPASEAPRLPRRATRSRAGPLYLRPCDPTRLADPSTRTFGSPGRRVPGAHDREELDTAECARLDLCGRRLGLRVDAGHRAVSIRLRRLEPARRRTGPPRRPMRPALARQRSAMTPSRYLQRREPLDSRRIRRRSVRHWDQRHEVASSARRYDTGEPML